MDLWPHQERVFDLLAKGKNVILQAPTGSGKTLAALYPFLYGLDKFDTINPVSLPEKCIYTVPMRVLAKQFHHEYSKIVDSYSLRAGLNISTAIQTGEQSQDPRFEANLTFATIDQVLSSFLLAPYSLPRRHANINAAAVTASYLIFDEFHLYDPDSMLPTTLHMLRMLKGIVPFVLMTATFSSDMLAELGKLLDAEVIPGNDKERQQLENLESQQKIRHYHVAEEPLSAHSILNHHDGRSLVICNTVDRAQQLYQEIARLQPLDTDVLLLHSRFLPEDRNQTEETIRAVFGKEGQGGSYIVVATQAIEVGVDMTSTTLHTELAPANAILQRAGRCARYPGNEGDVYIYPYTSQDGEPVDLLETISPYMSQREEFALTLEKFRQRHGSEIKFSDEQAIVSAVHGQRDRQVIQDILIEAYQHRRNMHSVMRGEKLVHISELVRNVIQQPVTIHDNPDVLLESPFAAPAFGLHPGTVQKYVQLWLDAYNAQEDDEIPWAVKWLKEIEDPEQINRSTYRWEDARASEKEVLGARLVVIHPKLATYDSLLGFLADRGGDWVTPLPDKPEQHEGYNRVYRLETYEDHIHRVYEAAFGYDGYWHDMADVAGRLERLYGWESGSIREATELAVLLHDVGKLSEKWQSWAQNYQQAVAEFEGDESLVPIRGEAYAHTTVQNDRYKEIENKIRPKRPWHSLEGAVACTPMLQAALGDDHPLFFAVLSAIARHHAPYSDSNQAFRLTKDADTHIRNTLGNRTLPMNLIGQDSQIEPDCGIAEYIAQPDKDWMVYSAYLLIVRVLRLADQLGTSRGALSEL